MRHMAFISAREAAERFGSSKDTCRRRAAAAHKAGDPGVQHTRHGWYAEEEWWRRTLAEPVPRGRPPRQPRRA